MNIFPTPDYGDNYSSGKLFDKLKKLPGRVIGLVLVKAFLLFGLLKKHDTPLPVKAAIVAVLGYLICPLDAVPDILGPYGYADDIALMAGLIASIDFLITSDMKRDAEARAASFTDDDEPDDDEDDEEEDP